MLWCTPYLGVNLILHYFEMLAMTATEFYVFMVLSQFLIATMIATWFLFWVFEKRKDKAYRKDNQGNKQEL